MFSGPNVPKNLHKWVPQINQKLIKSKPGPHKILPGALQCPRIGPGSSQDRPKVPRDAKVEAPSMPNDTHGHQNLQKIGKDSSLDLKVSFVVFPCIPKSAQGPQDAKVKPPIMPNDKFASQRYQDPLPTMPRICNPEAMSNDRGPAAEGVAHKIFKIMKSIFYKTKMKQKKSIKPLNQLFEYNFTIK